MNKSYLKLLLKQHRAVLIFLLLMEATCSLMPAVNADIESGFIIGIMISILIAVVMPMMIFSYMHRKSSVDLYFALPVSRKQLLVTGILFSWITAFGCFAVSAVLVSVVGAAAGAADVSAGSLFIKLAWSAYSLLVVILCVIFVYSIANNIFDGFVLVCAYALLPVALLMPAVAFSNTMIAGDTLSFSYHLAGYLSPLFMCLEGIMSGASLRIAVLMLIFGIISCIGLRREFIERKAERAQQISNGFFAYPLIIHIYAVFSIAFLVFSFWGQNYTGMYFLFYLVLFAIYIIATAVYKRSVRLSWKPILTFAVMLACCVGFAFAGWNTQGFGLAQRYSLTEGDELNYDYYNVIYRNDEEYFLDISLEVPSKGGVKETPAVKIMESVRQDAISAFYKTGDHNGSGNLNIYNTVDRSSSRSPLYGPSDYVDNTVNSHNYNILDGMKELSADDIKVLQDAGAEIQLTDINGNEISLEEMYQ